MRIIPVAVYFISALLVVALGASVEPVEVSGATVSAGSAQDTPLNVDPRFVSVKPASQNGSGKDEGTDLPPIAGPTSEIVGTVVSDSGSGPTAFYIGAVDNSGSSHYWRGASDPSGRFHLRLPKIVGGIAALVLFKHFDARGVPDQGASCNISSGRVHLQGTRPLAHLPSSGPAIVEGNTAYERGGFGQGLVQLHTRNIDPLHSRVLLDGNDRYIDTRAASDESIVGKLRDDTPLGRHRVAVQSGDQTTNEQLADIITEKFEPVGKLRSGEIKTVRLHIDGLGADNAQVEFSVSGAASVADGSASKTVPVVDNVANVDIRAEHPGELVIRTILDVVIPEILAGLPSGPEPGGPRVTTTEAPPTETPVAYTTSRPRIYAPPSCKPKITDGWFEPVQGVWQDDPTFDDHFTKQIQRTSQPGDPPAYYAELNMIWYRDTLLFGVEHYHFNGGKWAAGTHSIIHMSGTTDCSDPPKPVYMMFTLEAGSGQKGSMIWKSEVVSEIRLTGHHVKETEWTADLTGHGDGVPPPDVGPFKIAASDDYVITDELYRADNDASTGLAVTVGGHAHGVWKLKIAYIPVSLSPICADCRAKLESDSETIGTEAGKYVPDMYPMPPHFIEGWAYDALDLSKTNLLNPTLERGESAFMIGYARQVRMKAELARRFDALARIEGYSRFIVMLPPQDMDTIYDEQTKGYTETQKLVVVREGRSYFTVAHEIAHTLEYLWTDYQMNRDCKQPGTYHNKPELWANGYQIDKGNAPGPRKEMNRKFDFMSYTSRYPELNWISQCTYWNLANELRKRPDPPVMLVRGIIYRKRGVFGSVLYPMYDLLGEVNLKARPPQRTEHWALVVHASGGAEIASYPFEPQWKDENGKARELVPIGYQIPAAKHADSLEIRGPNGYDRRVALSSHPPVVRIETPTSGATARLVNDRVRVAWSASVVSGRPALATVLYSPNDGKSWYDRSFEQPISSLDVRIDPHAVKHLIRVVVTDGTRSAEALVSFTTGSR